MPDLSVTAIQSHSSALKRSGNQHLSNAVRCRAWSAGIVVAGIVFGAGKAQAAVLPWVAGVVGLLALADACCVALARRAVEAYHRFMARVPLNGGPSTEAQAGKAEGAEELQAWQWGCAVAACRHVHDHDSSGG